MRWLGRGCWTVRAAGIAALVMAGFPSSASFPRAALGGLQSPTLPCPRP